MIHRPQITVGILTLAHTLFLSDSDADFGQDLPTNQLNVAKTLAGHSSYSSGSLAFQSDVVHLTG